MARTKWLNVKVNKNSIKIVLMGVALALLVSVLVQYGIIAAGAYTAPILSLIAALFLLSEIGIKKFTPIRSFVMIVAILSFLSSIIALGFPAIINLSIIAGTLNLVLVAFTIVEIFSDLK